MKAEPTVRAVDRVFDLLDCFAETPSLGLGELCARTGLSKSTVHRLVAVLEKRGALVRHPTEQRFSVGPVMLRLAALASGPEHLKQLARPVMLRLRDRTRETTVLSLLAGSERVALEQIESHEQLRRTVDIGKLLPLFLGGAGKAMLAFLDAGERERVLNAMPRVAITPFTPTDPDLLADELNRIRSRGYSVSIGEYILGVTSIGSPVFDDRGRVFAALSVTGPDLRITNERCQQIGAAVVEAAKELTNLVGPDLPGSPSDSA
jgi:DNA-binding IclR family transcriptional regulator